MTMFSVAGVSLAGVRVKLGGRKIDNLADGRAALGERADAIVKTSGIHTRHAAAEGETSLSLSVDAAKELLASTGVAPAAIGAVVSVSFTPRFAMPGNAQLAQAMLGLDCAIPAFDLAHACAGYVYGLYLAAKLSADTGKAVLLLDGDVQTPLAGESTRLLLSDAGSATLVVPDPSAPAWRFAFFTDGSRADALKVDGGKLQMDGFGVFKFVADDVARFLGEFIAAAGEADYFVPHQANVYMAVSLAKALGQEARLVTTGDEVGNCASASVAVGLEKIAANHGQSALLSGFGGGLSASAARICL